MPVMVILSSLSMRLTSDEMSIVWDVLCGPSNLAQFRCMLDWQGQMSMHVDCGLQFDACLIGKTKCGVHCSSRPTKTYVELQVHDGRSVGAVDHIGHKLGQLATVHVLAIDLQHLNAAVLDRCKLVGRVNSDRPKHVRVVGKRVCLFVDEGKRLQIFGGQAPQNVASKLVRKRVQQRHCVGHLEVNVAENTTHSGLWSSPGFCCCAPLCVKLLRLCSVVGSGVGC